jgi:hypothetical protein
MTAAELPKANAIASRDPTSPILTASPYLSIRGTPVRQYCEGGSRPSDDVPGTLSIVTPDGTYEVGFGDQILSWTWSTPEYAAAWSRELPRLPQTAQPLTD